MNFRYSKQARKFLDKQNELVEARIKKAVDKLPLGDVEKMSGFLDMYRLRIGDFRILFVREENMISVHKIDNRGQVYKR